MRKETEDKDFPFVSQVVRAEENGEMGERQYKWRGKVQKGAGQILCNSFYLVHPCREHPTPVKEKKRERDTFHWGPESLLGPCD